MMSTNSERKSHPTPVARHVSSNNHSRSLELPSATSPSNHRRQCSTAIASMEGVRSLARNKHIYRDDGDDDDREFDDGGCDHKWQPGRHTGGAAGSQDSSVQLLGLDDGGVRDCVQTGDCWCPNNIYENVANATLKRLEFASDYGKLRKCEENIYENICEDCGRLYSAEKCAFCSVEDEIEVDRVKKYSKYSAKFHEFFGNFRIKPVKFGGSGGGATIQGKRKLCKSDIVHNVDGFEDVFRTNKSFDLGEICRMRDDNRSETIGDVNKDRENQQTGVDRVSRPKSVDQLALEENNSNKSSVVSHAIAAVIAATEEKARQKVRSASENLIDFSSGQKSESIYENLVPVSDRCRLVNDLSATDAISLLPPALPVPPCPPPKLQAPPPPPVSEWMRSLLFEAADYSDDCEVTYHVKSIPSVTFNDVSVGWSGFAGRSHDSVNDSDPRDLRYRIEEFCRNVKNNQLDQQCKLQPDETIADPVVITFGSAVFEDTETLQEQSRDSVAAGDKSEFVSGLLNIFDSVLKGQKEDTEQNAATDTNGHANDVIRLYRAQVNECDSAAAAAAAVVVSSYRLSQRKQRSARVNLNWLLVRNHLLDVSLCRVVISYERRLKVFLLVDQIGRLLPNLGTVLNRHKTYLRIMGDSCYSSHSPLRETVEIDRYFRFLESNETVINFATAKRRRRRRGEPLITADLQSNSSNEISCSSTTSGVHSDCGMPAEEHIYQPIWACKTEGSEPVYESPREHIYDYIKLQSVRDEHEWKVVDDFAFSKNNRRTAALVSHRSPPPVPNRNVRHPLDRYRNVCVLYNPSEPSCNRIVYDYRRDYIFDYRNRGDESTDSGASSSGEEDVEDDDLEFCNSYSESDADDEEEKTVAQGIYRSDIPSKHSCYSIPDCVQYWKFMLLNVNYNDDEEDVIMTEKTLSVIAENVDTSQLPPEGNSSPKVVPQTPPSPSITNHSHGPKFTGTLKSTSQIPISVELSGVYKPKSIENLVDVSSQVKEKSPTPGKRERIRNNLKNVLPLNFSWHSEDDLVFGIELHQVELDERQQVPRFIVEVVDILEKTECLETSGLYRASGNKNSIENIKKKLNEKRSLKKYEFLKKQDVHSLTGSLKLFIRELKSPLIPKDVYEQCVQKTKDEAETIENIKLGLDRMEVINRNTLRYLIQHLKCVHEHSHVNMMNSSNLAIVWGACLFASTLGLMESYENNDLGRINTLVKQLIDHYSKIFNSDK
ncbi:uncharacterized protein LOC131425766 [Malaya genurostris]|uniref:uncharacterized protein LOC131425766 n=1 Tax=Malaya genurostris TaxID=325434 RepID=UPI0026F3ABC3|nr:uncharacterized protein LOC131425766 [Malaya genurostris]XP_058443890.1 uncharacterized protein LOC131425766 [Malaya genurostris]XP_058443891.1 uncharacterized protein LOC131425766 [Malaya genurostris]XP_058443892.1 uncharacterized protein LOC131425766 [Malaya genurostris]XP_058443893.1 uncharacterized protein LOC131425766 [Malaya genurostris]